MTVESGQTPPAGVTRAVVTEVPSGRSTGWWGMVLLITSEATLFAVLLGSYFYLRFYNGSHWPPPGIEKPALTRPLVMTALLVPSSVPVAWALRGVRNGRLGRFHFGLFVAFGLGLAFLVLDALEMRDSLSKFTGTTHAYGSLFYSIKALDDVHVTIGLVALLWLLAASSRGSFGPRHTERVHLTAMYWHFIVVVWVAILFTVDLSVYL